MINVTNFYTERISEFRGRMERMREYLDLERSTEKVSELGARLSESDVWNDPELARKLNQELSFHQGIVDSWNGLQEQVAELELFMEMADENKADDLAELERTSGTLDAELERLETAALLKGEFDNNTAILTVHAGSGGIDAQSWAEMLMRMYLRWAERAGFGVEIADLSHGEEAGIHSATLFVTGAQAYGMLRSERGVHRLVRISPYDQAKRRHTSFAKVDVVPEISEAVAVDVRTEDLKVDTYRSSGAGGQHVNKTESAIRITHLPTGVVVTCQNERSQIANRLTAMRILKARLFELQQQERLQKISNLRGEHREAAWGNQIRSYVMQPYTQVKDRRTGYTTTDVQGVLDGDLSRLIRTYLEVCARLGHEPEPNELLAESD